MPRRSDFGRGDQPRGVIPPKRKAYNPDEAEEREPPPAKRSAPRKRAADAREKRQETASRDRPAKRSAPEKRDAFPQREAAPSRAKPPKREGAPKREPYPKRGAAAKREAYPKREAPPKRTFAKREASPEREAPARRESPAKPKFGKPAARKFGPPAKRSAPAKADAGERKAPPRKRRKPEVPRNASVSIARALSKLGFCSRSEAIKLVRTGQVTVNREVVTDDNVRVDPMHDRIHVKGRMVRANKRMYLMLNKPRGAVTTANDELGRVTVHDLLPDGLPHLSAVGRLDLDSEGLLLMTNDTRWANRIIAPESHVEKTYNVMVAGRVSESLLKRMVEGVTVKRGEKLRATAASVIRTAGPNTWVEIVLDEGKNRQIRRMIEALELQVERLQRVAIGPLKIGDLSRGSHRLLTQEEIDLLGGGSAADAETDGTDKERRDHEAT